MEMPQTDGVACAEMATIKLPAARLDDVNGAPFGSCRLRPVTSSTVRYLHLDLNCRGSEACVNEPS